VTDRVLRLANLSNGLAFPPRDGVCHFQSQHGHHYPYLREGAMPLDAVVHLLRGGRLLVVDGTRRRTGLPDALRTGVPTWCRVYNRALGDRHGPPVCAWETPDIRRAALETCQRPTVQTIRKLIRLFGPGPRAVVGETVLYEVHRNICVDDRPARIRLAMETGGSGVCRESVPEEACA
jgi:hypothetical protein